jgi:hypothetical protein
VKNKKYAAGLVELSQNRTLYINRALAHLWQVRLNVRPEITIFECLISKPRFFVFSPKQFLIQNYGKIEFELYKEIK